MMRLMRQRIVRVTVAALVVALALFAVPLAVVVRNTLFSEERLELERAALQAGARVGPGFATGDQVELPPERNRIVGIYDPSMRLRSGRGPASGDEVVRRAASGVVAEAEVDRTLVVAMPLTASEKVVGVVRAAVPTAITWSRVLLAWLVLAGLAGLALGAAVLVARRQARLLSAPLEQLSEISERVAEGDLTARSRPSRIPEIERVADAQNAMVDRLTNLLERERTFSANASHQLRTPLAGLQLGLESARVHAERPGFDPRPSLAEANRQIDQLHRTIDDLLYVTRTGPGTWPSADSLALAAVLNDTEQLWHGRFAEHGRRLTIEMDSDLTAVLVPSRAVAQILNVLLDNALRHGVGSVTIVTRGIGDTVALDVGDEGAIETGHESPFVRSRPDGTGHGIGLPLAHSIAEACGGRLWLASPRPTRFSLILPEPTHD
jgi:signal transduction histidine kinase